MIWLINTLLALGFGIVCIWYTTLEMREQGSILWFMPFFLFGIALIMLAALYHFQLAGTLWHAIFTIMYLASVVLIVLTYFYLFSKEGHTK